MSAREADGNVSNANFVAAFAVSIIQTLRRQAALISQAQTRFDDVTPTGGVWVLLSDVGFIWFYGQDGKESCVQEGTGNRFNRLLEKYVVGSKSFRPDQLFKVTEIKQLCCF